MVVHLHSSRWGGGSRLGLKDPQSSRFLQQPITHPRCYYKADTWYPQHFHTPGMPSATRFAYLLSHDASEMLYSPLYRKSLQTRQNCCITPYTANALCTTGLSLYSTILYSRAIQYTAYTLYSTIHRPSARYSLGTSGRGRRAAQGGARKPEVHLAWRVGRFSSLKAMGVQLYTRL